MYSQHLEANRTQLQVHFPIMEAFCLHGSYQVMIKIVPQVHLVSVLS